METFHESLLFPLIVNTDRNYWFRHGRVKEEDLEMYSFEIYNAVEKLREPYTHTKVRAIFNDIEIVLYYCINSGMSVPCRDMDDYGPDDHIEQVLNNAIHITSLDHEDRLRNAIRSTNKDVRTIQKYWRRCISDPNYQVCRQRLHREFTHTNQEVCQTV